MLEKKSVKTDPYQELAHIQHKRNSIFFWDWYFEKRIHFQWFWNLESIFWNQNKYFRNQVKLKLLNFEQVLWLQHWFFNRRRLKNTSSFIISPPLNAGKYCEYGLLRASLLWKFGGKKFFVCFRGGSDNHQCVAVLPKKPHHKSFKLLRPLKLTMEVCMYTLQLFDW